MLKAAACDDLRLGKAEDAAQVRHLLWLRLLQIHHLHPRLIRAMRALSCFQWELSHMQFDLLGLRTS